MKVQNPDDDDSDDDDSDTDGDDDDDCDDDNTSNQVHILPRENPQSHEQAVNMAAAAKVLMNDDGHNDENYGAGGLKFTMMQ